jgi:hypothetical protein
VTMWHRRLTIRPTALQIGFAPWDHYVIESFRHCV